MILLHEVSKVYDHYFKLFYGKDGMLATMREKCDKKRDVIVCILCNYYIMQSEYERCNPWGCVKFNK